MIRNFMIFVIFSGFLVIFDDFRRFSEPIGTKFVFSPEGEAGPGTNNALSPRSEGVVGAAGALLNQKPTILSI